MPKRVQVHEKWSSQALYRIISSRYPDVKKACVAANVPYRTVHEWVAIGAKPNVETLDQLLTGIGSSWFEWAEVVADIRGEKGTPPVLDREIKALQAEVDPSDLKQLLERMSAVEKAVGKNFKEG